VVFHRVIRIRQAEDEGNHKWMLRVEKLSDGLANNRQECVSLAIAMVITGLRSAVMKLSILSKQEEWTWETFIRLEDNARSAVKMTRGGNSYPVVSRWSQNDDGFSKSRISERRKIGIARASNRSRDSRRVLE